MVQAATESKTELNLKQEGKKAALVIASDGFRDEEYFVPREILEKSGMDVVTVSDTEGEAKGADGSEVEVDLSLQDLRIGDFEIVAFIGGPGALDHLDNEASYELAEEVLAKGKVLGAICVAPIILAKAGVLEGKEVTVWSSSMNKDSIDTVEKEGANYHDRSVVIDEKIVTADGPDSAKKFGEALLYVCG